MGEKPQRLVFTPEDHWRQMSEFARWEKAAGGPDPHLVQVGEMSLSETLEERVWRGGMYIATYNSPFAEVIWREFPWAAAEAGAPALALWLADAFAQKRMITRRERRCVRTPHEMELYLRSYVAIVPVLLRMLEEDATSSPTAGRYEAYWRLVNEEVRNLGRYVAIKLLEYLRRYCGAAIVTPDIRPRGGKFPRQQLGFLFPGGPDPGDNSREAVEWTNAHASEARARLATDHGQVLDFFELQVVLCDYKQSWKGLRQYPGRSIDSEMVYALQAEKLWGHLSATWEVRRRIFPARHLGEVAGWSEVRKDVAAVLGTLGYTWSDLLFDYRSTTDLREPVRWE